MAYTVRKKLLKKPSGKILCDDLILLKTKKSRGQYPETFRRVEMLVEVDGKEVVMAFITNNTQWAGNRVKIQNRQPSSQSPILPASPPAIQAAMG